MYRDESTCTSAETPYALWRPSGNWVQKSSRTSASIHDIPPQIAFRVRCVDAPTMAAEKARCARYGADTYETRTQCWTAGCAVDPQHVQCRPRAAGSGPAASPHTGAMALCAQHMHRNACENVPNYMCRFDQDLACVPNNVPHVPLHMQRRPARRRAARRAAAGRREDQEEEGDLFQFSTHQRVQLRVAGAGTVGRVEESRPSLANPRRRIYRVRTFGDDGDHHVWVEANQLRPAPAVMNDPYHMMAEDHHPEGHHPEDHHHPEDRTTTPA